MVTLIQVSVRILSQLIAAGTAGQSLLPRSLVSHGDANLLFAKPDSRLSSAAQLTKLLKHRSNRLLHLPIWCFFDLSFLGATHNANPRFTFCSKAPKDLTQSESVDRHFESIIDPYLLAVADSTMAGGKKKRSPPKGLDPLPGRARGLANAPPSVGPGPPRAKPRPDPRLQLVEDVGGCGDRLLLGRTS